MKIFLLFCLLLGAAVGGWYLGHTNPPAASAGRKVLYYQSPMHPWIKSDRPGRCTICGMELAPIYEGETGLDAGETLVSLSKDSVTVTNIETAPVMRQTLRRTIRVAGRIDDDDTTHRRLSATADGRVEKLFVNYTGAEVEAGQPLATLYSPSLRVLFGEYQLIAQQSPSPQRDRLLASSRDRLFRLGLSAAEIDAATKRDELPVELKIVSPIAGTVVQRSVYEGQYVKEGEVLFEVGDFSKMWFIFDAYERDLPWIRVGAEVEISVPALPGRIFKAPISFIDPNLDPETRSAHVRVVLTNPLSTEEGKHRHELLHKLYAEGRIVAESAPTLTVPRTAVLWPAGRPLVYVEKAAGTYEPREVQVGGSGDSVWEIAGGLKEGERVVVSGNLLLDGQAQINHPAETMATGPLHSMPEEQQAAAMNFFTQLAELSEDLASDQSTKFRVIAPKLAEAAQALNAAFGERAGNLAALARLPDTADLAAQRAAFYPLSEAAADFALELRRTVKGVETVHIFSCDMAKGNVPTAPRERGHWIQLKSDLHNPWWGTQMPECGAEVRP